MRTLILVDISTSIRSVTTKFDKKMYLEELTNCRSMQQVLTQSTITCSKLTIETLEQGVKYVQS